MESEIQNTTEHAPVGRPASRPRRMQ